MNLKKHLLISIGMLLSIALPVFQTSVGTAQAGKRPTYLPLIVSAPASSASTQGNIVQNPGFEAGKNFWNFYTDSQGEFVTVDPGFEGSRAGKVLIIQGANNIQLYQADMTLEPNIRYVLTFSARSNTGHDLTVSILKHGSPYTNYGLENHAFNLTKSWQTFSVEFTTANFVSTVRDARLQFWLAKYGSANDEFYFDSVSLRKVSAGAPPSDGLNFYIATNGSASGNGSIDRPWDLATALSQPATVQPGATLWLRGGRYGNGGGTIFNSHLTGTKNTPVTIRQFPGERATVDGGIMAYGEYTVFWGFEITNSNPQRHTVGSNRVFGLNLLGRGHKAINLIVNNVGHPGIGFWKEVGDGGEIYGCLIWGVGLYDTSWDPPTPRGSGIYAQNQSGSRYIGDVISFRNFSTGMKAYGESAYTNGFTFEGNVAFDNADRNIFVGTTQHPVQNLKVIHNFTYRKPSDPDIGTEFGYSGGSESDNQNLEIRNNYFVSGNRAAELGSLSIHSWQTGIVSNNTVVSRDLIAAYKPPAGSNQLSWDNNEYFSPVNKFWYSYRSGGYDYLTYDQWRSKTGFDAHSVYTQALPKGVKIFVRPNKYEAGRGHIIIYNWDKLSSVKADVSSVLKAGDAYLLLDAQNYFGAPVASGTYTGQPITIPMNLTQVSPIIGDVDHIQNVHTSAEFGVYILVKTP